MKKSLYLCSVIGETPLQQTKRHFEMEQETQVMDLNEQMLLEATKYLNKPEELAEEIISYNSLKSPDTPLSEERAMRLAVANLEMVKQMRKHTERSRQTSSPRPRGWVRSPHQPCRSSSIWTRMIGEATAFKPSS